MRSEKIDPFDARLEGSVDALTSQRIRRIAAQSARFRGVQRTPAIDRATEAVEHAPYQGLPHGREGTVVARDDFTSWIDILRLAKGHEEQARIAKSYDFRGER